MIIFRETYNHDNFYTLLNLYETGKCRNILKSADNDTRELYLGDIYFYEADFNKALETYRGIQLKYPLSPLSCEAKAMEYAVLVMTGHFETAGEILSSMEPGDTYLIRYIEAEAGILCGFYDRVLQLSAELSEKFLDDPETNVLIKIAILFTAVEINLVKGNFSAAYACIQSCEELIKYAHLEDTIIYAHHCNDLCNYFRLTSEYTMSMEAGNRALSILNRHEYKSDVYGMCHFNIATTLIFTGDYDNSFLHMKESAAIRESLFGTMSLQYMWSYSVMAEYYKLTGNDAEADKIYSDCIAAFKTWNMNDHPEILTVKCNYAGLLSTIGKYFQAKEILVQIIPSIVAERGRYNTELIEVYKLAAVVYNVTGESDEAYEYFKKALDLCATVIGTENEKYFSVLSEFADFLNENEQSDDAEELLKQSVITLESQENSSIDSIISANKYLIDVLISRGKNLEALFYCKRLFIQYIPGVFNDVHLIDLYTKTGQCYHNMSLSNQAHFYYDEALRLIDQFSVIDRFSAISLHVNRGATFYSDEKFAQALDAYQTASDMLDSVDLEIPENFSTENMQYLICNTHYHMRNYDIALKGLEKIEQNFNLTDNMNILFKVVSLKVRIFSRQDMTGQAIAFLKEKTAQLDKTFNDEGLTVRIRLLLWLTDLYFDSRQVDLASESNEQALVCYKKIQDKDPSLFNLIGENSVLLDIERGNLSGVSFDGPPEDSYEEDGELIIH